MLCTRAPRDRVECSTRIGYDPTMTEEKRNEFLRKAIQLSRENALRRDEPFGAVLVLDSEVVVSAVNRVLTEKDRTRHAELIVVSEATRLLEPDVLENSVLFSSTEPCPMCSGAIYFSRISRLVYACSAKKYAAISGANFIMPCRIVLAAGRRQVDVIGPVLEEEAADVHRDFW